MFQDIFNKAKDFGNKTYDFIANAEKQLGESFKSYGNDVSTRFDQVRTKNNEQAVNKFEQVKSGLNLLHTKTKDLYDWSIGIDDEFKSLSKYAEDKLKPLNEERDILFNSGKTGQIDDATFKQKYAELTAKTNAFIGSDEKLSQFAQRKKEVDFNEKLNIMPGAGVEGKIVGKTLRNILKVSESKIAEEIIPVLVKKFKIAENIAKELAPKLEKITDHQVIYSMAKAGETLSKIESEVGYLGKDIRSNLSFAIDRIVKMSPDKKIEEDGLKKLYNKTVKNIMEESSIPVETQTKNLLNILKKNLDDIHTHSVNGGDIGDYGMTQDIISKLEAKKPVAPDDTRFAYELLKKIETKKIIAKDNAVDAMMKAEKKTSELIAQEVEKSRAIASIKQQLPDLLQDAKVVVPEVKVPKTVAPKLEPTAKEALKIATKAEKGMKVTTAGTKKLFREKTGQIKQTIYKTTEEKVLREKMRTAQIYSKIGKQGAIKTTKELRSAVREYAKELPTSVRRKLLSLETFSGVKNKKELKKLLDTVDRARTVVAYRVEKKKALRELLSIRKIAREKGLIGNIKMKVRRELGIKTDMQLKGASKETIEKYKKIVQEEMDTTPKETSKDINWKKVAKSEGVGSSKGKGVMKKIGEGVESALGTVSSNIRKYGGDELFSKVRERRFEINTLSKKATDAVAPFQKGIMKLKKKWLGGKAAYQEITHALYNQDFKTAREIAKKYKFEDGFNNVIKVLDDIHLRANQVGLKVGKLQNYFPRVVKDYDGLFNAYNEKFGRKGRSFLDKLLTQAANGKSKKVSELTIEERSDILTNALRGYGQGKINVGNVEKARKFKELPVEFMKYYNTPEDSLTIYVSKMNEKITLKKLFGVTEAEQESIGALVDKMDMSPNDMARLKEALGAILSPQGTENIVLNKLRKSATLTLLSNVSSTLFQIADIGVNAYKHGSLRAFASLIRKKPIKRDELFTDIAHEFADSKVISRTLKAVGFDRLDRLNSEAFMGNAFRQATRQAKKGAKEIDEYANVVFRGNTERISKFMDDIKAGKVTDETRLYIFNKILDVSPRVMEEMPEAYAKHPNARLFYSMKSYGIKILDIYRNDVINEKKTWKKVKNAIRLTAILTTAGATGAQLRDWYNGKDTKFSDNVINNMFQIMMLSTYDTANIQKDGLGKSLLSKALPPSRWIDDLSKDILTIGDDKGLKSVRNIPIIGNEIYNRAGRGKESIEKANATQSDTKLKKLKPLKSVKPLKTLNSL